MNLQFRQGIVRHQSSLNGPAWLQKTSLAGTSIDLRADQEPTIVTFAHAGSNYLIEETSTVIGAWGGASVGSSNGPLPAGQTVYLYWDIDLGSGALTRGWTNIPWIFTTAEPLYPVNDLHWFDLNRNTMRVYRKRGNAPGYWQDRIRVFAGTYFNNSVLVPNSTGSQVGLTVPCAAGNLMLGTNNVPLKQSDGTFVTSTSNLIINKTSGQNVQFDAALVFAQAVEEIPAFYLVKYLAGKTVGLASSNDMHLSVAGISIDALYEQEVGQVISNGRVRNDQWEFTFDQIGKPIFCGPSGQLMLTPPPVGVVQQVGTVYDIDEVFINILSPIRLKPGQKNKPLILEDDGTLGQLPNGALINSGGTIYPTFTVNGKGLLFDDGTSTLPGSGSAGATLQTVYNNSEIVGGQAGITLATGKDFVIKDPYSAGNYFSISALDGSVHINGNLIVTGSTTTVDTIVTQGNSLKLSPNTPTITPFIIEPDLGVSPIVDLVTVRRVFGGAPVVRVDANGSLILSRDMAITGTINGIDIVDLSLDVSNHASGQNGYRHPAGDVNITPIPTIPGATNVQQALEYVSANMGSGGGGGSVYGYSHQQTIPATTWTISHMGHTLKAQVTVYDSTYEQIIPGRIHIIDINTIQVIFNSPQAGSAVVIMF